MSELGPSEPDRDGSASSPEEPAEKAEREPVYTITVVAESYALAQTEFETQIMMQREVSEWSGAAEELVTKYPALEPYREVFGHGVVEMARRNRDVNSFWIDTRSGLGTEEPTETTGSFEKAGPQFSRELLDSLLKNVDIEVEPTGPVVAVKGRVSIMFELNEADLQNVLAAGLQAKTSIRGAQPATPRGYYASVSLGKGDRWLPAMFIGQADPQDERAQMAKYLATVHESQHLRTDGFGRGHYNAYRYYVRAEQDASMKKLFAAALENLQESDQVKAFKSELEAYFTEVITYDGYSARSDAQITDAEVSELVHEMQQLILEDHFAPEELTPEFRQQTLDAVEALLALRLHYINECQYDAHYADVISSKMLQVLPLESWPAAVHVVTSHHRREYKQ